MSNVLAFPLQPESLHPQLIARPRRCDACGNTLAVLRRYPSNRAVAWFCTRCNELIRSNGKLFISHAILRSAGIEPDSLPEGAHADR
jgi:hypothetical protein